MSASTKNTVTVTPKRKPSLKDVPKRKPVLVRKLPANWSNHNEDSSDEDSSDEETEEFHFGDLPEESDGEPEDSKAETKESDGEPEDSKVETKESEVSIPSNRKQNEEEFLKGLELSKTVTHEFCRRVKPNVHYISKLTDVNDYYDLDNEQYLPGDVVLAGGKKGMPRNVYIVKTMTKVAKITGKDKIEIVINSDFVKCPRLVIKGRTHERTIPDTILDKFGVGYWTSLNPENSFQSKFYTMKRLDHMKKFMKKYEKEPLDVIMSSIQKKYEYPVTIGYLEGIKSM